MKLQAKHATFGYPVGFWGSELTHPWLEFTESGYECTIASPQGGKASEASRRRPRGPFAMAML